jgi:hypothetical protein
MTSNETYRNTLRYALALAGGEVALAARLNVSVVQIRNWLEGVEPVTDDTFLRVLDVVIYTSPAHPGRH